MKILSAIVLSAARSLVRAHPARALGASRLADSGHGATHAASDEPSRRFASLMRSPDARIDPSEGLKASVVKREPRGAAQAEDDDPDGAPVDVDAPRTRQLDDDALGPRARHAAQLAPPLQVTFTDAVVRVSSPPEAEQSARAHTSLEDVLPAVLKRIAWFGDARRGTVRMELGAGALAGSTLIIESEDGRLRVRMQAPAGVDAEAWRRRIAERFARKQLDVEDISLE